MRLIMIGGSECVFAEIPVITVNFSGVKHLVQFSDNKLKKLLDKNHIVFCFSRNGQILKVTVDVHN